MRRLDLEVPGRFSTGASRLRLELDPQFWVGRELQRGGLAAYEPETVACFLAASEGAGPTDDILDVGANVGLFAMLAASCLRRRVTAFEPTPELAQSIRTNAQANGLDIRVAELALAAEAGSAEFFLSNATDASNSLNPDFRSSGRSISVGVQTLDAFVAAEGMRPAVIKIDTETTEPQVLHGARATLAEHRPWIVCEVLPGPTERQIQEELEGLGYWWYQITDEVPLVARSEIFGDRANVYRNWLFAPEEPTDDFWTAFEAWRTRLSEAGLGGAAGADRAECDGPLDVPLTDRRGKGIASPWRRPDSATLSLRPAGVDQIQVKVAHPLADAKTYLAYAGTAFDDVPRSKWRVPLAPERSYEALVTLQDIDGDVAVGLWVLQYSDTNRLSHDSSSLRLGTNIVRFTAHEQATNVRVAFRFSGSGNAVLAGVRVVGVAR